ncbi:MAG: hypothetical protein VKL98_08500 [Cyanobacteriota bacterium]|nr:hypothetical protein [Cyanobacteriota bacterium]
MFPTELENSLLNSLQAYGHSYGLPTSPEQLKGVVATLLRLSLPQASWSAGGVDMVAVVDRVVQAYGEGAIAPALLNAGQDLLVSQVHDWRVDLEERLQDTLTGYLQSYAPAGLDLGTLRDLTLVALPLVNGQGITREEVNGLVSQIVDSFDLKKVLAAKFNPTLVAVVKELAVAWSQRPLEQAVGETVTAYLERFAPKLETIGEDLIERALGAVLKNQVDFGLDLDLNLANRQLLIQQVSFQLNIMKASPLPSKTAQQIAAELQAEIGNLQQYRQEHLGTGNAAAGLWSEDGLSVSSPWTKPKPKPGDPPQ